MDSYTKDLFRSPWDRTSKHRSNLLGTVFLVALVLYIHEDASQRKNLMPQQYQWTGLKRLDSNRGQKLDTEIRGKKTEKSECFVIFEPTPTLKFLSNMLEDYGERRLPLVFHSLGFKWVYKIANILNEIKDELLITKTNTQIQTVFLKTKPVPVLPMDRKMDLQEMEEFYGDLEQFLKTVQEAEAENIEENVQSEEENFEMEIGSIDEDDIENEDDEDDDDDSNEVWEDDFEYCGLPPSDDDNVVPSSPIVKKNINSSLDILFNEEEREEGRGIRPY